MAESGVKFQKGKKIEALFSPFYTLQFYSDTPASNVALRGVVPPTNTGPGQVPALLLRQAFDAFQCINNFLRRFTDRLVTRFEPLIL